MRLVPSNWTLLGLVLLGAGPAAAATKQPVKVAHRAKVPAAPPRPVIEGDPGLWIPADAYPPEAIRAGAQGRVAFELNVDPTGRVSGCRILSSSGTPVLDEATCQLVTANARFKPPHDAAGQAISSTFASAVRWTLPAAPVADGTPQ